MGNNGIWRLASSQSNRAGAERCAKNCDERPSPHFLRQAKGGDDMMGKSYAKMAIVCLAIGLAMMLCALFATYKAEQSFIDGAENGFGIDGMYASDDAIRPSMAILAGEDMAWQICNDDGSCMSGRLAATSDPNSFDLFDNDGADCGSVHLSYASRDGMDGVLYVSHETGDFKMRRTNRVPAFIEE